MSDEVQKVLLDLGKAALIVIGAAAVYAVLFGFGGRPANTEAVAGPTGASVEETAPATATPTATATPAPSPLRATIVSATFTASAQPSGVARNRARVAVELTVRNTSPEDTGPVGGLALVLPDGTRVRPDRNAREAANGLFGPLAANASVTGELRFETSGAVTTAIRRLDRVTLRASGRAITAALQKSE